MKPKPIWIRNLYWNCFEAELIFLNIQIDFDESYIYSL